MAERMKEFGVEKDPVTGELVRTDPPPEKPTKITDLSLSFLNSLVDDLLITLINAFRSLNNNGFFAF